MPRIALYPGSFDPPTFGHMDIIKKAACLADHLIVGVGANSQKRPLFLTVQRVHMLSQCMDELSLPCTYEVTSFEGLTTDFARLKEASFLIRGLRESADFDFEMPLAGMNAVVAPGLLTVFIPASTETRPISSTLVRQVIAHGGDVSGFVPKAVLEHLHKK